MSHKLYAGASGVSTKAEKIPHYVFLPVAGPNAQKLYQTLDVVEKDKIQILIEAFHEYYAGKANLTVVRYQFNAYEQMTESMESYIRELKQHISYCNYRDMEDDLLCDKLVCGIQNDTLCNKLLQRPKLCVNTIQVQSTIHRTFA